MPKVSSYKYTHMNIGSDGKGCDSAPHKTRKRLTWKIMKRMRRKLTNPNPLAQSRKPKPKQNTT